MRRRRDAARNEDTVIRKIVIIALVVMPLLAACGGSDSGDESGKSEESNSQPSEPDLSGIPKVVAVVNGDKIGKDEFVESYTAQYQQTAMQSQQSGEMPKEDEMKKQVAEGLVAKQLLLQEADKKGIKASNKQVNKRLDELAQQGGAKSKDELLKTLKDQQGLDKEQVLNDLKTQVKLEQLVKKQSGDPAPTNKELRQYYKQMVEQQSGQGQQQGGQETPEFDEIKPQLKQQLEQQKTAEAEQALVKKLRKNADVKINL